MAKTLADVINKTKSLADVISRRVAANAPRKTGNLQKALRRANNVNTMLEVGNANSKSIPAKSFTLSIDYSPSDAPYGKFWNDPTISHQVKNAKTKNKDKTNFVDKALMEPEVKAAIDQLTDMIGDMVMDSISDMIDDVAKY